MNKNLRNIVYQKYDGHCAYCGKKISTYDMQIDHLVPLRRGDNDERIKAIGYERGSNDLTNLMPSCRSCNFRKGLLSLETFRQELIKQRNTIVRKSFQVRQSISYGLLQVIDKPIVFYFEQKNVNSN